MLNKLLYRTLKEIFDHVEVIDEAQVRMELLLDPQNADVEEVLQEGERLSVRCPFCSTNCCRLIVSYAFHFTDLNGWESCICHSERQPLNRQLFMDALAEVWDRQTHGHFQDSI